jgi:hypothetical protein
MTKFEHPLSADSCAPPLLAETSQEQFSARVRRYLVVGAVLLVSAVVVLALARVGQSDDVNDAQYRFKAASSGSQPNADLVKAPAGIPAAEAPTAPIPARTPPREAPAIKGFTTAQAEQAMKLWVELWSAKRTEEYLRLFDSSFPNREAYVKNRAARIAAAKLIEVKAEALVFKELGNNEIAVQFIHHYRSDTFESRERKELVWRLTAEGPRILRERTLP